MTLTLITGPANSGKTAELHRAVRDHIARGGSAALVVPAEPDVSRDTHELASSCPLGLTITTFDGLLERLWMKHGDGRRLAGEIERIHLLEETVRQRHTSAERDVLLFPGTVELLGDVVRRVAEAPEEHERLLRAYAAARAHQAPAEWLLECAADYLGTLASRGLVEPAEAFALIARETSRLSLPGLVAVGRFTGLTASQERFIVGAASAIDVCVTLTYDDAVPATAAASPLVERLRSVGDVDRRVGEALRGGSELHAIECRLGTVGPLRPLGGVVLSAGAGEEGEADRIAAELQQAHSDGTAFSSMAVAFRRPERHILATARSCTEAGIPVSIDLRARFVDSGLGATLVSLLEYQNLPGQELAVIAALRSPYCPGAGEALDEVDAWVRRGGTRGGVGISGALRRHDPDSAAFLDRIQRASRGLARRGDTAGWYRLSTEMLARAQAGTRERDTASLLDAAAQRTFARALSVLGEDGVVALEAPELARVLRRSSVTTAGPEGVDAVRLMSMERVRGLRFAIVVLGGLSAAEFPGPAREMALSPPGVAAALAAAGFGREEPDRLADERLLFYQAATRATERLILSYASSDSSGREVPRSVFIEEVVDLYRDDTGALPFGEPALRVLDSDAIARDEAAPETERRTIRSAVLGGDPPSPEAAVRHAHARHRARPRPASVDPARIAGLDERRVFSASEIEMYLGCPYRWFIERVVRPTELDSEFDAAALGRLGHALLHGFYTALKADGHRRMTVDLLPRAEAVFAEVADDPKYAATSEGPGEQAAARAIRAQVWRLIEADATFLPGLAPVHTEWAFGMSEGDAPEDLGGFSLVGRIDRIDANEDGFVITDYKRSRMPAARGRAGLATNGWVQLPLYAAVVARRLGLRPLAGIYRGIAGGKPRGFVSEAIFDSGFVRTDSATPEEIDALIAGAIERSRSAVEGMKAGAIPAEPLGDACPTYCSARAVCPRMGGGAVDAR